MLAGMFLALALLPQLVDKSNAPAPPAPGAKQISLETRADVFMARKMYREAIETYEQAARRNPKSWTLQNKLGIAYHQQNQLRLAERCYQRAIKLNKGYADAINNLGTVYYAMKQYGKAISTYGKALKYADSASIHSNLGTAYFARKRFKEASEQYQIALKLDPEIFEHRNTMGSMLQERNVEDRAKFHYYMAKTYAAAGQNDRAIEYLRKALEEGLKDKEKIPTEKEFAGLRELPEFKELMAVNVPAIPR